MRRTELQKEWEIRIAEYQVSGQRVKEWCTDHNVKPHQLWYWLRRCKTQEDISSVKSTQWLPFEVSVRESRDYRNTPLVLRVGETYIEVKPGFDAELLAEAIRVLIPLC